jgi:hypothetical protein
MVQEVFFLALDMDPLEEGALEALPEVLLTTLLQVVEDLMEVVEALMRPQEVQKMVESVP